LPDKRKGQFNVPNPTSVAADRPAFTHHHDLGQQHAFSFFTPVFGVLFSGILILGETISPNLVMALILVSIGMVLVNYQPKPSQSSASMQD